MKPIKISFICLLLVIIAGCGNDWLNVQPTDRISGEDLLGNEDGVKAYFAYIYHRLPIEDFESMPDQGFRFEDNNNGFYQAVATDEATGSEIDDIGRQWYGWWEDGYALNRDINNLFGYIADLNSVSDAEKQKLEGEAWFFRAYTYFALAKRYGGVPIIKDSEDPTDSAGLIHLRATERETWDFVLECCDKAAEALPEQPDAHRACKWTALALKSRAALFAASVGKFNKKVSIKGEAVDKKLAFAMNNDDAQHFYQLCIEASEQIIKSGHYTLYMPNPSSPGEAAQNYQRMFENPSVASCEAIFIKGYTRQGDGYGSNQDIWCNPRQTTGAWPHSSRICPTVTWVDHYESYDHPGQDAPIITTEDGDYNNYEGYNPTRKYIEYNDPIDIFKNKDARLFATIILPNSIWKNTKIIMQAGYIKTDGTPTILNDESTEVNGVTYYTYGAPDNFYSGFGDGAEYPGSKSRTGFGFKKYLQEDEQFSTWHESTTDWMEFRLAEIYLNYEEAVAESGYGDRALAKLLLNATRRRAGFNTDIDLTSENVQRERMSELAFENQRYWDLTRRREWHEKFHETKKKALLPILDLRTMKYLFVRAEAPRTYPHTYEIRFYYRDIPGIEDNHCIQNPNY